MEIEYDENKTRTCIQEKDKENNKKEKELMENKGKKTICSSNNTSNSSDAMKIVKKIISRKARKYAKLHKRKHGLRIIIQLLQRINQRNRTKISLCYFFKLFKATTLNNDHKYTSLSELSQYNSNEIIRKRQKKLTNICLNTFNLHNHNKSNIIQLNSNTKESNEAKQIVSSLIDDLINKSMTISSGNCTTKKFKTFQSYTPQYSIKGFSFTINSPNNTPLSLSMSTHTPSKESSTTNSMSAGQRTKYPLTPTSLSTNSIYNHLILNINNTNHINQLNSFPYQIPIQIAMLKPSYIQSTSSLSSNDYLLSEKFCHKLNADLQQFTEMIDFSNTLLHEIKEKSIIIVESIAANALQSYYSNISIDSNSSSISFELFGSFANGLSIDTSDIDILIKYSSSTNLDITFISILQKAFNESHLFTLVFAIPSAKVPVIKLIIALSSIIKDSNTITMLHNELPLIDSISIDIIFANQFNQTFFPSLEIVKYIKSSICYVPISKGILFFLKKFLACKKMNSYYNGGLSSFAIFILLFGVIKVKNCSKGVNGAALLMHFLEFYGRFNFGLYGVNLNMGNPFGFLGMNNAINTPVIIDPVTNLNIGSGTFKIEEIQEEFIKLIMEFKKGYQGGCEENMIMKALGIDNNVKGKSKKDV